MYRQHFKLKTYLMSTACPCDTAVTHSYIQLLYFHFLNYYCCDSQCFIGFIFSENLHGFYCSTAQLMEASYLFDSMDADSSNYMEGKTD